MDLPEDRSGGGVVVVVAAAADRRRSFRQLRDCSNDVDAKLGMRTT